MDSRWVDDNKIHVRMPGWITSRYDGAWGTEEKRRNAWTVLLMWTVDELLRLFLGK